MGGHILPAHVRARRGDGGGLRRGGADANKKPRMSTPRVYCILSYEVRTAATSALTEGQEVRNTVVWLSGDDGDGG